MSNIFTADDPLMEAAKQKSDADSLIKPWQSLIKKGDYFYYFSDTWGIVVWGEVLEDQEDSTLKGYRHCQCYMASLIDGIPATVHVSVIHKTVSQEIFEKARRADWPHDELMFTKFAAQLMEDRKKN